VGASVPKKTRMRSEGVIGERCLQDFVRREKRTVPQKGGGSAGVLTDGFSRKAPQKASYGRSRKTEKNEKPLSKKRGVIVEEGGEENRATTNGGGGASGNAERKGGGEGHEEPP